jgi:hypothetical protein
MRLHVFDLFVEQALACDPLATCREDDLKAAWENFANAGWSFQKLEEQLALRGITATSNGKGAHV